MQKAGARFSTTLAQPFARIGSHPRSDVVIPGDSIPSRCLYFHATDAGLFCVDLTASGPAEQALPVHGWVYPNQLIRVGPYEITVETDPPGPVPPIGTDDLDSRCLDEADAPNLTAVVGGEPLGCRLLHRRLTIIGRHRPSTVRLTSRRISACHCLLWWDAGTLWVVDLLSGNGTRLNGEHVDAALVNPGDTLKLGPVALTYEPPAVQRPAMSVVFPAPTIGPDETPTSVTETELAALQLEAERREMDRRQAELETRQRELEARLREIESRSAAIEETRLAAERKLLEQTETLHRLLEELAERRQELAAAEKRLETARRPDEPSANLPAVTPLSDASRGDVSAQGKNGDAGLAEEPLYPIRQTPRFWQEDPGPRRTGLVRPLPSRDNRLMNRPASGGAIVPPGTPWQRPNTARRFVTSMLAGLVGAAAAAAVVWFAVPWPSSAAMTMQFDSATDNVAPGAGTPAAAPGAPDDLILRPTVLAAMLQDPSLESIRRNTPNADLIDWLRGHVDVIPLSTPGQVRIVSSSATATDSLSILTALAQAIRQATETERQDRRREINSQYAVAERQHRDALDRLKELAASLNTGDPEVLTNQVDALLAQVSKTRSELLPLEAEIKVLEARSAPRRKTPTEHPSPSVAAKEPPVVADTDSPEARLAELTARRGELAQSIAETRSEADRLKQAAAELAALRDESELHRSRMAELDRIRTQLDLEPGAGVSAAVVEYPLIIRDGSRRRRSAALLASLAGFVLAGLLAFRRQPSFRGPLLPAELLVDAEHAGALRSTTASAPSPTTGTTAAG